MADQDYLNILQQGMSEWNSWRDRNRDVKPDLHQFFLRQMNLAAANLREADLSQTDLSGANLSGARLERANLMDADLSYATLHDANLSRADLSWADLSGADLSYADLSRSTLLHTDLTGARLTNSRVYGISAWDLKVSQETDQSNLVITQTHQAPIMVDNLEVAQFIYLLLNNEKLRHVIDTITSKVVLILGRFTSERKAILEAIRGSLRQRDYLPVLFDFEKPRSKDLTETISTLAHMARFIIADITDAKSIPQELQAIVPNLPSVPVQPILLASQYEYGMFEHFRRYPWMLETFCYDDRDELLASIEDKIISPAEEFLDL